MNLEDILSKLHELSQPKKAVFKAKKFGIVAQNTLGIYQSDLNLLAREIGKNKELALALYDTDIYEAKLLCAKIFPVKDLTPELVNKWCLAFDNWEICDTYCMVLFAKMDGVSNQIIAWSTSELEYVKRAAFATIAALCSSDKKSLNPFFISFFPIIVQGATDDRLYVKKAISWALISMGKRNVDLKKEVLTLCHKIHLLNTKSSKWINQDVCKELNLTNHRLSNYPRHVYGK